MNIKKVLNLIGEMLKTEALCMILPFICGLIYRERSTVHFLVVGAVTFALGRILTRASIRDAKFFSAEGFVTVALGWVFLSIFGALPFFLSN